MSYRHKIYNTTNQESNKPSFDVYTTSHQDSPKLDSSSSHSQRDNAGVTATCEGGSSVPNDPPLDLPLLAPVLGTI